VKRRQVYGCSAGDVMQEAEGSRYGANGACVAVSFEYCRAQHRNYAHSNAPQAAGLWNGLSCILLRSATSPPIVEPPHSR